MKKIILFSIIGLLIAVNARGETFETTGDVAGEKAFAERTSGGFNYYSTDNNFQGHSESNGSGGYDYYDSSGNKVGSIIPEGTDNFMVYDSNNVQVGALEKLPSKKYRFKSSLYGNIAEYDVMAGGNEDVGALNPSQLFQNQ